MVPIARRNLLTEKGKFAISVAGVGFAVVLMLVVVSLYRGWSGIGGIIEELPADLWVMQQGTTDPFHSVSLLDEELASEVDRVEGVTSVTKAFARTMSAQVDGANVPIFLMSLDAPRIGDGSPFLPEASTITVDESFSDKHGVGVGDTVVIGGRELRIADVFSGGNAVMFQFAFVAAADARDIFGFPGAVNYLLVQAGAGADGAPVAAEIEREIAGTQVLTGPEFVDGLRREINEGFLPVVAVLVLIGFVVGVAVIGLTTYTATIEKSRDFGVMKAIGGTGGFLYRIVVSQSVIVAVVGFAVGLALAFVATLLAQQLVPEFVTDLRWYDALGVFVAALLMAAIAAYVPITRINRIDPAMVFRA